MNSATHNFFRQMRETHAYISVVRSQYELRGLQKYMIEVFDLLDAFVTGGLNTKNEAMAYVCSNWLLPSKDAYKSFVEATGSTVSYSAFRVELNNISLQFMKIFPFRLVLAFGDGTSIAPDREKLDYIYTICQAVLQNTSGGDITAKDILVNEVIALADYDRPRPFTVSECSNEIKVIKTLSKSSVFNFIDNCDREKLTYVVKCLNEPLLIKRKGERGKTLNSIKLDFLLAFNMADSTGLGEDTENSNKDLLWVSNIMENKTPFEPIAIEEPVSSDESIGENDEDDDVIDIDGTSFSETSENFGVASEEPIEDIRKKFYLSIRDALVKQSEAGLVVDNEEILAQASKRCSEWFRLLSDKEFLQSLAILPSDMVKSLVDKLDNQ